MTPNLLVTSLALHSLVHLRAGAGSLGPLQQQPSPALTSTVVQQAQLAVWAGVRVLVQRAASSAEATAVVAWMRVIAQQAQVRPG